jgi:hypothetical protein
MLAALVLGIGAWQTRTHLSSGEAPAAVLTTLAGERVSLAASFENVAQVRAYVRDHGVDYPVLLGDDALLQALHVDAFPTVYFLDAHGRVQRSATGYTTTLGLLARLLL